ncbi:MAG: carbamoyl-phosphate synthase large subunit [Clostridia bacterium]|nr:carbamoyl-phosphate synthase large subunit [Clostridia bacterium]
MPKNPDIKKVLVIGSGPIVIGQAAEFDYAGAQACRVLKSEGIEVVLCNSNPATIMTDKAMADSIYLEPLTETLLERIIKKERPDSLLAGLGGQTGLNLAMELSRRGVLDKYGVKLLGTGPEAIDRAEDRELFKKAMQEIGQPVVASDIAHTVEDALRIAEKIGYPVIVRPAFTLGGGGGGAAESEETLRIIAGTGLEASPIKQILVEKAIFGWKEIEFETMRDVSGNVIAVCSMENIDPVGVHTGDSLVVSPALTLSDREYQMLRSASLDIITHLGIVGGCNVQLALDPDSFEYAVIEVNPRVSRSSALASKATGYPIAKITAKIALGYDLDEITNEITGKTCACFEPALDYVVVKMPKWPFDKFAGSSRTLGTQMKATGEVMAIAPSFEMALMKAVRGAENGLDTLNLKDSGAVSRKNDSEKSAEKDELLRRLRNVDDRRIYTIFEAIKSGISIEEIHDITKIDLWFLARFRKLAEYELALAENGLDEGSYFEGKRLGYTDAALLKLSGSTALPCPSAAATYKMVDTCSAEFEAETPYFYSSFDNFCESRSFPKSGKPVIMVLGSGPIRIGQGIEFDYSSVHCVWTLREMGYDVIIVNNNPETVSTDYDTADRLYFEPLTPEDVMHIINAEKPEGVVVAFGGQTAIKLTGFLDSRGIRILGTSAEGIDLAEDRGRFDALLEKYAIRRPKGAGVNTLEDALKVADSLGYPVLLRPSYVIGGQNMTISRNPEHTREYMERILSHGIDNPVLIDKYMPGIELEADVISDGEDVLIPGIMEHIERAGVHSGDSIAVYPPYNLNDKFLEKICDCSEKLALALGTKGLVNIQYLIYGGELYVIEVNPRASRTVPYISKVTGIPMTDLACRVMLGAKLKDLGYGTGLAPVPPYCAVKVPVFSFEKLTDANSILGPEMKSTGEVLGLGKNMAEALFKGLRASGLYLNTDPSKRSDTGILISVDESDYHEILAPAKIFRDAGITVYATKGTGEAIIRSGTEAVILPNATESPEIRTLMENGKISCIAYTGAVKDDTLGDYTLLHMRAMQLGIPCLTSADTLRALSEIIQSRYTEDNIEPVDICHMRTRRLSVPFTKMQTCGNDYIFIDNTDGIVTCPESLCVNLCAPHTGIGADGIVLIEKSGKADALMRTFNKDGSEGLMAGNNIRCVAKLLHDRKKVPGSKEVLQIETASGIYNAKVYLRDGNVNSVAVDMGGVYPADEELSVSVKGRTFTGTPVNTGNPHFVIFTPSPETLDVASVGPEIEHDPAFPGRTNVEFCAVVDRTTIRARIWERGNGETLSAGTSAVAAACAAVSKGLVDGGRDITVKLPGGELTVTVPANSGGNVILTGSCIKVFDGVFEL